MIEFQLFQDYTYYRKFTHHVQSKPYLKRPLNATKPRLAALKAMAVWCNEQGYDPRLWLYSLFQRRRWLFAPKFEHLISEKHRKFFENVDDAPLFQKRNAQIIQQNRQAQGTAYMRWRDLSNSVETIKRNYLAQGIPDRCMDEMKTTTLGYHPQSLVCARCPTAQACRQQLETEMPDVMNLRKGAPKNTRHAHDGG